MIFNYSSRYAADIGGHVFPTRKFSLVAEALSGKGRFLEPALPAREDMLLAHHPAWVDKVIAGTMSLDDELLMELPFGADVSLAHRLQVSGTIAACRQALDIGVGLHIGGGSHHAFADHGEGFCVLNDIACGIMKMRAEGRIRRAAIVDLDVHQGNGTASIFKDDPGVFTFSMHQDDIYPARKTPGSLDVGLSRGTGDADYLRLLEENLPRVFDSAPELVVYQSGVDCAAGDLLGGLALSAAGVGRRDEAVFKACKIRGIPVAVTLGGGYGESLESTAKLHAGTISAAAECYNF